MSFLTNMKAYLVEKPVEIDVGFAGSAILFYDPGTIYVPTLSQNVIKIRPDNKVSAFTIQNSNHGPFGYGDEFSELLHHNEQLVESKIREIDVPREKIATIFGIMSMAQSQPGYLECRVGELLREHRTSKQE